MSNYTWGVFIHRESFPKSPAVLKIDVQISMRLKGIQKMEPSSTEEHLCHYDNVSRIIDFFAIYICCPTAEWKRYNQLLQGCWLFIKSNKRMKFISVCHAREMGKEVILKFCSPFCISYHQSSIFISKKPGNGMPK